MQRNTNKAIAITYQPQLIVITNVKDILRKIRNYLAGQVVGFTRDETLLDEVLKCTFCRVTLERQGRAYAPNNRPSPGVVAEQYDQMFFTISQRFPSLFGADEQILLDPEHVAYIDREFANINLTTSTHDIIGDIYEIFIGSGYRGQEGQFFTPRIAVRSLVELASPSPNDLIIDPACGSGSFLLEASRYIRATDKYAQLQVHGIDKDAYLARLAQLHLALQYDTLFPISTADSLSWNGEIFDDSITKKALGQFTLVLTNPPFGSKIMSLMGDARYSFELAHKWKYDKRTDRYYKQPVLAENTPPQVLFVERCLSLLADGGRMGIVLPESILSNPNHRYLVQYILEHTTPIAIIGMPESLFKTSGRGGTHTKVCLLLLEKRPADVGHHVFMAEARWCGHDSRAREIEKDDMPTIIAKFHNFRAGKSIIPDQMGFLVPLASLSGNILAPRYYNPTSAQGVEALSDSHDFYRISDLVKQNALSIATGDEIGKLAYGTGGIPFVRTSDLSNWEIKSDPKHLVSQEVYEQFAKRQDVREGDILLVRDGSYLIGTCAFVSSYDTKIVYQSHIYKIRVNPTAPFDNYLLLAVLSSAPVVAQIKAMSFTQDIIDTLGDRLYDIVLPIPKQESKRKAISDMVRHLLEARIEAREMARLARQAVVEIS